MTERGKLWLCTTVAATLSVLTAMIPGAELALALIGYLLFVCIAGLICERLERVTKGGNNRE